ncbi:DUF4919 domain-containing protein [Flavobacterium suaedae]|uniref:DUF4919 domain-containing protein n=1 Tax=Flavobacterium suaedae TaxID=1767027 RepID=A0ABQ1JSX8_9FLAO|nr:DUF4919 domain-containing protein [Flavobacterium suaedae]GGB73867.1 DUF4919 domain-containing protein [Flavobacterium suaedae]
MKNILLFFVLLFTVSGYAQTENYTPPDYDLIEKNSTDKNSELNFELLFERYKNADSTMTIEDKRHLYYGYSFSHNYSPYGSGSTEVRQKLNKILQKQEADKEDLKKIIEYTDELLSDFPFSIKLKDIRIYCFRELGMIEEARKENFQTNAIIDAMLSTGNGVEKETSIYVINVTNEYELISIFGFSFGGEQSLIEGRYDYLAIEENPYEIEGLYFDVSRSLNALKF